MLQGIQIFFKIAFIGISATIILDLWAILLNQLFRIPITNWAMVGRWIGHIPSGTLVQKELGKVSAIPFERVLGWLTHYTIGISYIIIIVIYEGIGWLSQPTIFPPLLISWLLLIAPFFIMMPCMGAGFAGAKTPNPTKTRLISILGHTVFGLGIFISAIILNLLMH